MVGAKKFPKMILVRQEFARSPSLNVRATVRATAAPIVKRVQLGSRIALAVGSRGIANLHTIVGEVIHLLKAAGGSPFIVPAMGSHGGATPEGQVSLLAEYGITEAAFDVPIRAAMDTVPIGTTADGVDVLFSAEAQRADGIVIINRVKPHTDFSGALGSGLLKMLVVGLGKRNGAANFHVASARLGYERVLRTAGNVVLNSMRVMGGLALVEDQFHETAQIHGLLPDELIPREERIFTEAKRLMPRLPFEQMDLLIVDRIGKNISGAGMDPNVTGRWVHGYSSSLSDQAQTKPLARRIFVRDLTPETHGNAVGIGLADLTTTRLVRAMDQRVTYVNALTALTPNSAKIPIHFDTDQEGISRALESLGLTDLMQAKIVRIADTLALDTIEVSAAYADELKRQSDLQALGPAEEMGFDRVGNLLPMRKYRP
jgi:hypothetical protein